LSRRTVRVGWYGGGGGGVWSMWAVMGGWFAPNLIVLVIWKRWPYDRHVAGSSSPQGEMFFGSSVSSHLRLLLIIPRLNGHLWRNKVDALSCVPFQPPYMAKHIITFLLPALTQALSDCTPLAPASPAGSTEGLLPLWPPFIPFSISARGAAALSLASLPMKPRLGRSTR
jgi:hypothetical protein